MALSDERALISRRQLHAVQVEDAEEGFLLHDILLVYMKREQMCVTMSSEFDGGALQLAHAKGDHARFKKYRPIDIMANHVIVD